MVRLSADSLLPSRLGLIRLAPRPRVPAPETDALSLLWGRAFSSPSPPSAPNNVFIHQDPLHCHSPEEVLSAHPWSTCVHGWPGSYPTCPLCVCLSLTGQLSQLHKPLDRPSLASFPWRETKTTGCFRDLPSPTSPAPRPTIFPLYFCSKQYCSLSVPG